MIQAVEKRVTIQQRIQESNPAKTLANSSVYEINDTQLQPLRPEKTKYHPLLTTLYNGDFYLNENKAPLMI